MKPTINQINGRTKNNQTIEFYKSLSNQRQDYSINYQEQNYRNRSFDFNRVFSDGTIEKRRLSITGNFTFGAAVTEFSRICNISKYSSLKTKYGDFELNYGHNKYSFTIRLTAEIETGISIEVQSYDCEFLRFKRFPVKSNKCYDDFDHVQYFEKKILPIYFFPEGLFRNIQLVYKLQKNQVAAKYKELLKIWKKASHPDNEEMEIIQSKALQRRLLKKLKIKTDDYISCAKMIAALKTYKRQSKITPLQVFPSPFALLEELSWQYDTEDDIMNEAEKIIYDDAILYI